MGRSWHKRALFVEEYIRGGLQNAKQAAIRAGYSPRSAYSIAGRVLRDPRVQAAISERLAEIAMGPNEVLFRLAEHARGDIGEIMRDDGTLDLAGAKAAGRTRLIKSISDTDRGLRVELYDAQSALQLIGKHHGLFRDLTVVRGKGGGPIEHRDVSDPATDERRLAIALAIYERIRARAAATGDGTGPVDPDGGATDGGLPEPGG